MKATDAYARLRALGLPAISTTDAAAVLGRDTDGTNKILRRLAAASLVAPVRRGLWALAPTIDPLLLPDFLTAPHPSYVSLQTALYQHGLIEQIPAVTYAVSLDRTQRIRTRFGTFSIHRMAPEVFGGFEVTDTGIKLAQPEKALFDVFYLSATRNRQFGALPELEIPRTFDRHALDTWTAKITSPILTKIVKRRVEQALGRRRTRQWRS